MQSLKLITALGMLMAIPAGAYHLLTSQPTEPIALPQPLTEEVSALPTLPPAETVADALLTVNTIPPAPTLSLSSTAPRDTLTTDEINQRFIGLLSHVHWLIENQPSSPAIPFITDSSLRKQVNRLERQIFRSMDDESDGRRELRDDLIDGGSFSDSILNEATLNNPTFVDTTATLKALSVLATATLEKDLLVAGNVGIGTSNPGSKLDVTGEIKASKVTTGSWVMQDNSLEIWGGAIKLGWIDPIPGVGANQNYISWANGPGDWLILGSKYTGKTVLNLKNASYLGGNQPVEIAGYSSKTGTWGVGGMRFADNGSSNYGSFNIYGGQTNNPVALQPYGGSVGIGTTTPSEKLTVVGNVYADSFIDNGITINAPDYVFDDPTYYHLTLEEIESFTDEKSHLPWLTPRGPGPMSLSARINEILEALENLFLHFFDLTKRLLVVEAEVAELKEQNQRLVEVIENLTGEDLAVTKSNEELTNEEYLRLEETVPAGENEPSGFDDEVSTGAPEGNEVEIPETPPTSKPTEDPVGPEPTAVVTEPATGGTTEEPAL